MFKILNPHKNLVLRVENPFFRLSLSQNEPYSLKTFMKKSGFKIEKAPKKWLKRSIMIRNLIKTFLFLLLVSCLLLILGYVLYGRQGLLVGFVLAVSWNLFIYFYSDQKLRDLFACREIEGADPWQICQNVGQLASQAGIPTPKVFIHDGPTPTAFSIGKSWSSASIVISKNLTQILSPNELKAILAHEIFHIKQLDILTFGVGMALFNFFICPGLLLDRLIRFKKGSVTAQHIGFFTTLLIPLALFVLKGVINFKGDYLADDFASQATQNPEYLANALWKLTAYRQARPLNIPIAMAHIFIVNPLQNSDRYFHSMPNTESRIRHLVSRYPL